MQLRLPRPSGVVLMLAVLLSVGCASGEEEAADRSSVRYDIPRSMVPIAQLAEEGDGQANLKMGLAYAGGGEVTVDHEKAFRHFHIAAEANIGEAFYRLGAMYMSGRGTKRDVPHALQWYERAIEAGVVEAASYLSFQYLEGIGLAVDCEQALRLARHAAVRGDAEGQALLGHMYLYGRCAPMDKVIGATWVELAVRNCNTGAARDLSRLYAEGEGVEPDLVTAYMWLKVVFSGDSMKATDLLSVEEAAFAEAAAEKFLSEHCHL